MTARILDGKAIAARVTDDVLRTLVLASSLLGVDRAMVIGHTKCRMAAGDEDETVES